MWMCAGVRGCSQACVGVFSCIWVRMGVHEFAVVRQWCVGVHGYMWVYAGVPGCAWVCLGACVWDEFSEYLLET